MAEPFQQAELTNKVATVLLVNGQQSQDAAVGDIVRGDVGVKTGENSRAQLQFPDLTVFRLGANGLFSFKEGSRTIDLEEGTLLFSSPKGIGGGDVKAGAVTAAVTGTTFLLTRLPNGEVELTVLEGTVTLTLASNGTKQSFTAGQNIKVRPGATAFGVVRTVNLGELRETSDLLALSDFGSLPEDGQITDAIEYQRLGDTSLMVGDNLTISDLTSNPSNFTGDVQSEE